jgi:hypothetical protein
MGKSQLRFAAVALVAGLAWGYISHRRDGRATLFAILQGLEWFVAYGGAAALIEGARGLMEDPAGDEADAPERITHFRQEVTESTGTEA